MMHRDSKRHHTARSSAFDLMYDPNCRCDGFQAFYDRVARHDNICVPEAIAIAYQLYLNVGGPDRRW